MPNQKEVIPMTKANKQFYLISATGNFWFANHLQGPLGLYHTQKCALKFAADLTQKYNPPYTWTFGDQNHPKIDTGLRLQLFAAYKKDYTAIYPTHTVYYDPNTGETEINPQ